MKQEVSFSLAKDLDEELGLHCSSEQRHSRSHLDLGRSLIPHCCPNRWHCLVERTQNMPILQDLNGQADTIV